MALFFWVTIAPTIFVLAAALFLQGRAHRAVARGTGEVMNAFRMVRPPDIEPVADVAGMDLG
jgi:hypothetical protein